MIDDMGLFGIFLIRFAEIVIFLSSLLCLVILYHNIDDKRITMMDVVVPIILIICGIITIYGIECIYFSG